MPPAGSKNTPENRAREKIDALVEQAGWTVQNRDELNLAASRGVAVREFKMKDGHGFAANPPPDPDVIAEEIAEGLRTALEQIEGVLADLQVRAAGVAKSGPE